MSLIDADTLYALLPAFIRLRDQTEGGGALQALIGVIAEQAQVVGAGLDQLYDDQFIETCAPWVVPYIGDLIGFAPLRPLGPNQPSATRAEVADTIGYRRRKGTIAMVDQLCSDVTGWPGMAVEFFTRLSTTQYVRNHLRPDNTIVDVHSPMVATEIGGAFDPVPRSVDVRRISIGRGRYNIPNIGLYVWRLATYGNRAPACSVGTNRYTFDPFGGNVPLVNPPPVASSTATATFALPGRVDLPFSLQRYPLYLRQQDPSMAGFPPYAAANPVSVAVGTTAVPGPAIGWCDLTNWTPPTLPGVNVAVDPVLGRLVFATPPATTAVVTVGYTYAFSGDYGGGDYARPIPAGEPQVAQTIVPFATADLSTAGNEVVEISDSGIRAGNLAISPGPELLVVRAAEHQRPVLAGNLTVTAVAGASLTLRGIGIGGSLTVSGAGPFTVNLEHCTVRGNIDWSSAAVAGNLVIDHSLCGAIEVNSEVEINIADSAVDGGADNAPALSGGSGAAAGSITIVRSTIIGAIAARTIPLLENSIVTGSVVSAERQAGCVRYSFVPLGSQAPRQFRCQPDFEVASEVASALADNPALTPLQRNAIHDSIKAWLLPAFTSRIPGQPGYLQLADAVPSQITAGADEGDEMGVFFGLFSGRRESNLTYRLNEYLRVGLEVGVIHAS